jgi:hypothetical protein
LAPVGTARHPAAIAAERVGALHSLQAGRLLLTLHLIGSLAYAAPAR